MVLRVTSCLFEIISCGSHEDDGHIYLTLLIREVCVNKKWLHCAVFRTTGVAKCERALRDKSYETLHSVTHLATVFENVARQVAETVAERTTRFYFQQ